MDYSAVKVDMIRVHIQSGTLVTVFSTPAWYKRVLGGKSHEEMAVYTDQWRWELTGRAVSSRVRRAIERELRERIFQFENTDIKHYEQFLRDRFSRNRSAKA